jgi:hypothetical protein
MKAISIKVLAGLLGMVGVLFVCLAATAAGANAATPRSVSASSGAHGSVKAAAAPTCPAGYACLYPTGSEAGTPIKFYTYGAHNLSNVYGMHEFFNAQTGGAVAYLCTGYNGGGSCQLVRASFAEIVNFTPINSVYLSATARK